MYGGRAHQTRHLQACLPFVWYPKYRKNDSGGKGFLAAHLWYFADIYGEDGRAAEEPHHAVELTSEEVLRLVVTPDEQWRDHFDEMGVACLPQYLCYLVGYLGGPLVPEEAEHYRQEQVQQEALRRRILV